MKKWIVTHTSDLEFKTLRTTEIEGISYTDAYVNFMVKYPNEMIIEINEKEK